MGTIGMMIDVKDNVPFCSSRLGVTHGNNSIETDYPTPKRSRETREITDSGRTLK